MLRRIQVLVLGGILLIAALSTGAPFLFFLVYLAILVVGGSYVVTRFGLADLEAGYVLDRVHAQAGDILRASYTVRNTSRLPKFWLEVHNPTSLPVPLPGQAITLGPRGERSWSVRVPLTRRGHFRVEPLALRTGDPLGLFESHATVGSHATVIVYPRVESLPGWRLPPALIEGSHAQALRTQHTTPHATSIRPYAPGDAYNRIHWRSSARQGELQVKEFDLEQTADLWAYLDLQGRVHAGDGDESTLEYGVRAAAAIGAQAIYDNRAVAMTASAARVVTLQPDRGQRQYQKIMQLLAAANADGSQPLQEVLIENILRLRRGTTAVVITPSTDRDWVKTLSTLQPRGVAVMVVALDAAAFDTLVRKEPDADAKSKPPVTAPSKHELPAQRALLHALAEYDLTPVWVGPGRSLGEQLVTRTPRMSVAR